MAEKHDKAAQYSGDVTNACETALMLLLKAFGSLKTELRLIGGLVPRFLVMGSPPEVPPHVGTTDVDIVLDVAILAMGEDYSSLRDQLKRAGFERHTKPDGSRSSWQWDCAVSGLRVMVEFLVHSELGETGLLSLVGEEISACRIPHAGMASKWYYERELRVELPNGDGVAIETIRYADPAAYVALKGLALEGRHERKDVADLVYVLQYAEGAPESVAQQYAERLEDVDHRPGLIKALETLHRDFCDDAKTAGHQKTGPGRYVQFHGIVDPETQARTRRDVSGLVNEFLTLVEMSGKWSKPAGG